MTSIFADSWAWIALFNRRDQFHKQAVRLWQSLLADQRLVVTSDFVWLETLNAMSAARLRAAALRGMDAVRTSKQVETIALNMDLYGQGLTLYRERPERDWSLTDCTSFAIMKDKNIAEAFTGDHHFKQSGFKILLT